MTTPEPVSLWLDPMTSMETTTGSTAAAIPENDLGVPEPLETGWGAEPKVAEAAGDEELLSSATLAPTAAPTPAETSTRARAPATTGMVRRDFVLPVSSAGAVPSGCPG